MSVIDPATAFRHIVSPAASALENMATDEALLNTFKTDNKPILRLYTWHSGSVTIGTSQSMQTCRAPDQTVTNMAKRTTGGGVMFHGHDVSYALLLPAATLQGLGVKASYEYITRFLLLFYQTLGLPVGYAKDDATIQLSKSPLCQEGYEAYDIVCRGHKLGGNAQRRRKHVLFQHGSVPLTQRRHAPANTPTTLEALDIKLTFDETVLLLSESFQQCFGVTLEPSGLNPEETAMKTQLLKEKQGHAAKCN